jgi:hypothetical protein
LKQASAHQKKEQEYAQRQQTQPPYTADRCPLPILFAIVPLFQNFSRRSYLDDFCRKARNSALKGAMTVGAFEAGRIPSF